MKKLITVLALNQWLVIAGLSLSAAIVTALAHQYHIATLWLLITGLEFVLWTKSQPEVSLESPEVFAERLKQSFRDYNERFHD